MSKMSGMYIEMQNDVWSLTYSEFVEKWGEHYAHMYNDIRNEELGLCCA